MNGRIAISANYEQFQKLPSQALNRGAAMGSSIRRPYQGVRFEIGTSVVDDAERAVTGPGAKASDIVRSGDGQRWMLVSL